MSHSVTITRTTTSTTNTSYIVLNTGYMKTVPGILKLLQLLLGIACVGILSYYYSHSSLYYGGNSEIYFFLMAVTFMIGTFILLLSCLVSLSTGGIISKTIYEVLYHAIAGILILVASVLLLVKLSDYGRSKKIDAYWAAGIMGLINAVLYFISTFLANKSYRGI